MGARGRYTGLFTLLLATTAASVASGVYAGRGVAISVDAASRQIVIQHEAISNYMASMTMPFFVKDTSELVNISPGEGITFSLHITDSDSWVDNIHDDGLRPNSPPVTGGEQSVAAVKSPWDCQLTNEFGRGVLLGDFRGQALAITFFYTSCPVPDFCPRLSKNFQEASQKLRAMTNAPAKWRFLSVSFDPKSDTPEKLRAYGASYAYDSLHWSFLTGAPSQIAALAQSVGVKYKENAGTIDHNFRTLIINAAGQIQMVFPMGGNLSDQIVDQMLKAAMITNKSRAQK